MTKTRSHAPSQTAILIAAVLLLLLTFAGPASAEVATPKGLSADVHPDAFTHPGLLHTAESLERMRDGVRRGAEPWKSAWTAFQGCKLLAKDYTPKPFPAAGRDKKNNTHQGELSNDMSAAYYNAIAYAVSGDEAYARKSVEIMDAWSGTCKAIVGSDARLAAGIYGYKVANAAEIIRATYPKWPLENQKRMANWLNTVWYPVVKDFGDGNWGTCCIPTVMSIGVFCDDHAIFTSAVYAYQYGCVAPDRCGVTQYVLPTGQSGESGRDQPHAQGGVAHLAEAAEIAWSQGIDLYGFAYNRLLKAYEYQAKYKLGHDDVAFERFGTGRGKQFDQVSALNRGKFSPAYEIIWNHYVNRRGLGAPYTFAVATRQRPEGWSVDHPGIGTLTCTIKPDPQTP